LILVVVAQMCFADDRLVRIPYDPETDLPKLASDLGVSEHSVEFHSRCAYVHLTEWAASANLRTIGTCVVALTPDRLIIATWKADQETYVPVFKFQYRDVAQAALSIEGTKYQLQLTTPEGFLAVTTTKYRVPPPGDSSGSATVFKKMTERGVLAAESRGRVDLKQTQFHLIPIRKH
jgi:hypothetical protein